jgi:prevent-host-death family protein
VVTRQIAAARFKERCLAIIDHVDDDGIVITKHGKPVAKLIPIRAESAALIGALKSHLSPTGELLSTRAKRDAES